MSTDNPNNGETKPIKERSAAFQVFVPFFTCLFFIIAIVFAYSTGVKDGENNIKQKMPKIQEQPQAKQEEKKTEQKESKPEVKPEENKTTEKKPEQKNVTVKSNYKTTDGKNIKIDNSVDGLLAYTLTLSYSEFNIYQFLLNCDDYVYNNEKFSVEFNFECLEQMRACKKYLKQLIKVGIPEMFVTDYNKVCQLYDKLYEFAVPTFGYDVNGKLINFFPKYPVMMADLHDELLGLKLKAYDECYSKGYTNLPQ